VAGVDFYGELLRTLESVGRFERSTPGTPVGSERRRYYVLLYDWRKDNIVAVRKLHAMIEQIRVDYGDPNLRVDIVAHSNGGTITNWYLRYGPNDVPAEGPMPTWEEGDKRIRRVIMLGTPMLGAVTSLERLVYGTRLAVRTVPVEVIDNGVGMPADRLEATGEHGIGLRNVNERLRVIYGANYQLRMHSVQGQGTLARIEIPELTVPERASA